MKISESWLREFSNPDVSTQLLCDQLTLAGLEVDGVESVCGEFSNVVVGEILEILPHPNADKLRLCKVDVKSEIIDIVCGAPNIYVGMKAPVAMIGALLPGGFEIKKSKLRGEPSNGMMCSEKELGISDGQGGLFDLPKELMVGDDIKSALSLDDVSIDIDLTPNRADCLSVIGVAREVSTLNRIDIKMPLIESVPAVNDDMVEIDVQDRLGCPKYCARIIRDINPKAETPLWLKEKIRRSGLRSISPVVDVTNYILLKYGQPLHAFDLNKIDEKIIVRRAVKDEQLTLLDETKIKLNENTLIIADIHKPLAMAGIMGGLDSSINDETKDILVESAFFDPIQIAGKARQYGLHTDSSHRYERGVDPELCERVIEEATKILLEIVGGNPGPVAQQVELKNIPIKTKISLRSKRVKSILGFELNDDFIKDTLVNLGLKVEDFGSGCWVVTPPSYRFDINIEEDLIEELVRIYGYAKIPESLPNSQLSNISIPECETSIDSIKQYFVDRGYYEAITYSFIDQKLSDMFYTTKGYKLSNPISSDMSVMRQGLLPGLLTALKSNLSRKQNRIKLFEVGTSFEKNSGQVIENTLISGVAYGNLFPLNWKDNHEIDFYDVKGDLEQLLSNMEDLNFIPLLDCKYFHPGQSAKIFSGDKEIGKIGVLHPNTLKFMQIKSKSPIIFELNYSLIKNVRLPRIGAISKYPSISRDLALIVDENITSAKIIDIVKQAISQIHAEISVFDVYSGDNLPKNKKSIALNLILQSYSKTLIDEDIVIIIESIVDKLSNDLGAILRE